MTITYQFNVASSTFFGFTKLLGKWRGSVYKLVYKEIILYMTAFGLISFSYRVLMNPDQRRVFEKVSLHCARYLDLIPLSFVLGFYVTYVVGRWWSQFTTIPWPDRLMNTVILYVDGVDERGRMIRRTLMRYWNLSFVMILSSISIAVKKRFPTLDHLVEAGFMTSEEHHVFNQVHTKVNKYFIPMCWFLRLLDTTKKEGRIKDNVGMKHILEELNDTRTKMSLLWCHDWVTIPLVYTQVVTWATHLFFVASLVGRQFLDTKKGYRDHDIDLYVPIFTLLQFFFYMGWLKVAEQLINPFGEDDDDFETNWLIDRHIQVCYLGVDELYVKTPPLEKDLFWYSKEPDVPYTQAALIHRIPTYCGSTMHLKIPEKDQPMIRCDSVQQTYGPSQISFCERLKRCFTCQSEPRPFDFDTMWKDFNPDPHNDYRNRAVTSPIHRTLGKKESLMAEDYLHLLNAGFKRSLRIEQQQQQQQQQQQNHYSHSFPSNNYQFMEHNSVNEFDALPLVERRSTRPSFKRQESVESALSFRASSSPSIKHEGSYHREDSALRYNQRYSSVSDGTEEDIVQAMIDDVNRSHPLTRLSEVENETDGDYSSATTPVHSPDHSQSNTLVNNPEEKNQPQNE